MPSARLIKSDPLGVVDTRLTDSHLFSPSFTSTADTRVTSDSRDLFASSFVPVTSNTPVTTGSHLNPFSPFFATFTAFGLDGPADTMTTKQPSLKQEHGFRGLQESSLGLRAGRHFPRLVLDAATNKYVLDNIGEPANPQRISTPNSENDSNEEPVVPHATESLLQNDMPNTEEFNYDCFQDSPEADSPKGRSVFGGRDSSQSPTPTKVRLLSDQQQLLKPPIAALANHHPAPNVSSLKKSGNPGSVPRSVHFSPASSPIPSSPAQRPLPSVERKQDHLASSRQKQHGRWKVIRRATPHRVSPQHSPMNMASAQATWARDQPGMRLPFHSSLPNATLNEYSGNAAGTLIADEPKGTGKPKKKVPRSMAFLFAIYRPREQPAGSPRKDLKYVIATIVSQATLSEDKMPRFAPELEQLAFQPPLDEVLCQFCIIVPAILITMPVGVFFYTLQLLENTRIGAAIIYFVKVLFSTFVSVVIRAMATRGLRLITGGGVRFVPNNSN
jgi:hypothetical protein